MHACRSTLEDPTRASVRAALRDVTGEKLPLQSRYALKPSEIVDITAAISMGARVRANALSGDDIISVVARRECPEDPDCVASILNDVAATAPHLEGQAEASLAGLEALLTSLSPVPGRKAVLFVSGGLLVSDRTDGRPDVGDMSKVLGQRAARANATVYTVQVDAGTAAVRATSRRPGSLDSNRDRQLLGNWLDAFSVAAGGMRIYVPVGGGDFAFDRVLRETAAHYLLGVQPEESDRDGKPRELKVKLQQRRGLTVHSRQWVVIPVKKSS